MAGEATIALRRPAILAPAVVPTAPAVVARNELAGLPVELRSAVQASFQHWHDATGLSRSVRAPAGILRAAASFGDYRAWVNVFPDGARKVLLSEFGVRAGGGALIQLFNEVLFDQKAVQTISMEAVRRAAGEIYDLIKYFQTDLHPLVEAMYLAIGRLLNLNGNGVQHELAGSVLRRIMRLVQHLADHDHSTVEHNWRFQEVVTDVADMVQARERLQRAAVHDAKPTPEICRDAFRIMRYYGTNGEIREQTELMLYASAGMSDSWPALLAYMDQLVRSDLFPADEAAKVLPLWRRARETIAQWANIPT